MSEEHGYQRSGKKCREKFENLYKYYKKTKEGKAGRHDGKHYRFFRQLEALYGENSTNTAGSTLHFQTNQEMFQTHQNNKHCDTSTSLTNSTEFDTSSCDDDDNDHSIEESECMRRKRRSRRSWKVKIKEFIDLQMKKLVEKQEEWMDKIVKTMEEKEKERIIREEEWKKQEEKRLEREQRFWAKERAWIEARDAALMEALQNVTGSSFPYNNNNDHQSCLHNQGSNYCDINDQRKENVGKAQTSDGSSPSNFNVGNVAPNDSCNFPFLMSEGGNWWDSYGLKLSKANQNQ